MSDHAILQPSAMDRTVNCPGSVPAQLLYPDEESEAAREGTAAHWIFSEVLDSYKATDEPLKLTMDFIDVAAPNGVVIDDAMIEGADMLIDDVLTVCQADGLLQSMFIEHRVTMEKIHPLNWGTLDCAVWNAAKLHLILWDYKYGFGVVEPENNYQTIDYAVGLIDELCTVDGITDEMITIEIRICQPRAWHVDGPIRSWIVKLSELRGHINQMSVACELAFSENPPTKAGKHCTHCTAQHACVTNQQAAYNICDVTHALQIHNLSPAHIGVELTNLEPMLKLLESRVESLQSQALVMSIRGDVVPGYIVGTGRGSEKWNKPVEEVIAMGDILHVDLRKPVSVVTPVQARKLKLDESVILGYSQKHQGAKRLVKSSMTLAQRTFGAKKL